MAIPDFQTLMRPLLELHADGGEKTQPDLRVALARHFALTEDDLAERLPSGTARTFVNRVAWASTHMKEAGLLMKPRRGISAITDRGRTVLREYPERVDMSVLEQFSEYVEFRTRSSGRSRVTQPVTHAAERVGRSGDGGMDGVIREDMLGLDAIYVQAKKWAPDRNVGPREIREFLGALQDVEATKGIFITTSSFSPDARELARRRRIVLIDGLELATHMVDAGVGVATLQTYELKRIDEDYFAEVE